MGSIGLPHAFETKRVSGPAREHPQRTAHETEFPPSSFFGKIRKIYAASVLKTQLEQLKASGCYEMFTGKWMPCYGTRRINGANVRHDGLPPSLFWESDIGKWIEATSYFLQDKSTQSNPHKDEFESAIDKLITDMEAFQAADGYLNVYFQLVDKQGKFRNLRDMHEMYNAGHLLEGALADYHRTGSRRFLDVMIKNIDCIMRVFGPDEGQRPGYPGHPELELAMLRLYAVTADPRHIAFARHLLAARGTEPASLGGKSYFQWEAQERCDDGYGCWMKNKDDLSYHQAHKPLHEQSEIRGHSVRALYLLIACADIGDEFLDDAKRLWANAVTKKLYITGGVGSEPQSEGFSELDYYLPFSTSEGGCYAETCASIALMMVCERLLARELHGRYRDVLELCLYNAVLGGASLDASGFSYANKLATYGEESGLRSPWFEVCCCPPNLSRTMGMLGGFVWSVEELATDLIVLNVYLLVSANRTIVLPGRNTAVEVQMESGLPQSGNVHISVDNIPDDVRVVLRIPHCDWMDEIKWSKPVRQIAPGFVEVVLTSTRSTFSATFDLPVRLVTPHPRVGRDAICVTRGPVVYVAEDVDNESLDDANPHFDLVGLSASAEFQTSNAAIGGVPIVRINTQDCSLLVEPQMKDGNAGMGSLWPTVGSLTTNWSQKKASLSLIPWFSRGNRGGKGHQRAIFRRL